MPGRDIVITSLDQNRLTAILNCLYQPEAAGDFHL